MAHNFKHSYNELANEAMKRRVNNMMTIYNEVVQDLSNYHVKISTGNRKTGNAVPSVSLIPVRDCANCKLCARGCYDLRHDVIYLGVQKSRAINSAILHNDMPRFFAELRAAIVAGGYSFFRFHVGGDIISTEHFLNIVRLSESLPGVQFLIFTKVYTVVNHYLDNGNNIPDNLHVIFSDWKGAQLDNSHNLPVSSPVWYDDKGNEIERGPHTTAHAINCGGDCSECARTCGGCWGLKNGQTVLFEAH